MSENCTYQERLVELLFFIVKIFNALLKTLNSDFTYEVEIMYPSIIQIQYDEIEATRMCEKRGLKLLTTWLTYYTYDTKRDYVTCSSTIEGFNCVQ